MCGRYYIDDETVTEIEKIVRQVNEKMSQKKGDIYPTNKVPIIHNNQDSLTLSNMTWGFPNHINKGAIINARSETVKEKRTFSKPIMENRCIIPDTGFYEWIHLRIRYVLSAITALLFIWQESGNYMKIPNGLS